MNDDVLGNTLESTTNTEITIKNTYINSFFQSLEGKREELMGDYSACVHAYISEENIESFYEMEEIKEGFKNDNDVERIEVLDSIKVILFDLLNTTKKMIRVQGEEKPAEIVKAHLKKINTTHILHVIDTYCAIEKPIKNWRAYLITLLYNSSEDYNHWSREISKR